MQAAGAHDRAPHNQRRNLMGSTTMHNSNRDTFAVADMLDEEELGAALTANLKSRNLINLDAIQVELGHRLAWIQAQTIAATDALYPDGAMRFYEGDDPDGFASEMLELFGIDVSAPYDPGPLLRGLGWDELIDGEPCRAFFIPGGLVGTIETQRTDRWPLGS